MDATTRFQSLSPQEKKIALAVFHFLLLGPLQTHCSAMFLNLSHYIIKIKGYKAKIVMPVFVLPYPTTQKES